MIHPLPIGGTPKFSSDNIIIIMFNQVRSNYINNNCEYDVYFIISLLLLQPTIHMYIIIVAV